MHNGEEKFNTKVVYYLVIAENGWQKQANKSDNLYIQLYKIYSKSYVILTGKMTALNMLNKMFILNWK